MGGRSRSHRWQETFARSRSQHIKQFFQGENSRAPGKIDHGWSAAQLTLTEPSQPTNGHRSQPLSGLQAIDLRRIEGQAGERGAPQRCGNIASPALLLEPPALFEFAIGIILNVPARTKRLQSRKAISEPARTH